MNEQIEPIISSEFMKMLDSETDLDERKTLLSNFVPNRLGIMLSLKNESETNETFLAFALSKFIIDKNIFTLEEAISVLNAQKKYVVFTMLMISFIKSKLNVEQKLELLKRIEIEKSMQNFLLEQN